jgi:hypothetical protein
MGKKKIVIFRNLRNDTNWYFRIKDYTGEPPITTSKKKVKICRLL